jgi:HEAT repeat protein
MPKKIPTTAAPKPARPTSYDRAAGKFDEAALATPEGKKKALAALKALRKKGAIDDPRWIDRCVDLMRVRHCREFQIELKYLMNEAATTLAYFADESAPPKLFEMLDEPTLDTATRILIITVFGALGDPSVVPDLIAWFNRQNNRHSEPVYRHMADALIRLANADVFARIERTLRDDALNKYQQWTYERALESISTGKPADNAPRL